MALHIAAAQPLRLGGDTAADCCSFTFPLTLSTGIPIMPLALTTLLLGHCLFITCPHRRKTVLTEINPGGTPGAERNDMSEGKTRYLQVLIRSCGFSILHFFCRRQRNFCFLSPLLGISLYHPTICWRNTSFGYMQCVSSVHIIAVPASPDSIRTRGRKWRRKVRGKVAFCFVFS